MAQPPAEPRPLLPREGYRLGADEVRELWSFVHGDIMIGGLRDQLRAHLGLCDRHTWGHAVVEVELWQYGPGRTGGHQPFDVAVLYTDLLEEVSAALQGFRPSRRHRAEDVLGRRGKCRICAEIAGDSSGVIGYAAQDTAPLLAEANQMVHTQTWVCTSAQLWQTRACPACRAAAADRRDGSVEAHDGTLQCRRHLLEAGELDVATARGYAGHLTGLAARLRRHLASMTDSGTASTADDRTAWIETLGWFAGWALPLTLAAPHAGPETQ